MHNKKSRRRSKRAPLFCVQAKKKCFLRSIEIKEDESFNDKDQRDADSKGRLSCFMMEKKHPTKGPKAPAKKGEEKEVSFRDAPFFMDGFIFIDAKGKKSDEIDDDQIEDH